MPAQWRRHQVVTGFELVEVALVQHPLKCPIIPAVHKVGVEYIGPIGKHVVPAFVGVDPDEHLDGRESALLVSLGSRAVDFTVGGVRNAIHVVVRVGASVPTNWEYHPELKDTAAQPDLGRNCFSYRSPRNGFIGSQRSARERGAEWSFIKELSVS